MGSPVCSGRQALRRFGGSFNAEAQAFSTKSISFWPHTGQLLLDVAFAKFEPAAVWAKPRAHWRRWSFPILSGTGEAEEGGPPEPRQSPLITGGLRNAATSCLRIRIRQGKRPWLTGPVAPGTKGAGSIEKVRDTGF